MNINASTALYSPLNTAPRDGATRTQSSQTAAAREVPESRQAQESPSSLRPDDRNTSPAEQNRRVESSPSTDSQQAARSSSDPVEQVASQAPGSVSEQETSSSTDTYQNLGNASQSFSSDDPSNTREARPVVIDQQPTAATRTFLDVANQNDEFRIIDTFV